MCENLFAYITRTLDRSSLDQVHDDMAQAGEKCRALTVTLCSGVCSGGETAKRRKARLALRSRSNAIVTGRSQCYVLITRCRSSGIIHMHVPRRVHITRPRVIARVR